MMNWYTMKWNMQSLSAIRYHSVVLTADEDGNRKRLKGGGKMSEEKIPRPGQFVKILRGRDQGKYAIIVGVLDSRYVLIADGDKKKFDRPKKKNLIHLQLLDAYSGEVADSLRESGRVTNGKLRFALDKFLKAQAQATEAQRKENEDGQRRCD